MGLVPLNKHRVYKLKGISIIGIPIMSYLKLYFGSCGGYIFWSITLFLSVKFIMYTCINLEPLWNGQLSQADRIFHNSLSTQVSTNSLCEFESSLLIIKLLFNIDCDQRRKLRRSTSVRYDKKNASILLHDCHSTVLIHISFVMEFQWRRHLHIQLFIAMKLKFTRDILHALFLGFSLIKAS